MSTFACNYLLMKLNFLLFILFPFYAVGQIPGYYSSIDFNQTGDNLKIQLTFLITSTHVNQLNYTPDVWNAIKQTDLDPANPSNVFLLYGYDDSDGLVINDRTRDKNLNCTSGNCTGKWTREHVFPQSLGNPALGTIGPGADAHNLRAVDSDMNNLRANKAYDAGSGSSVVLGNGNFYPGDEWKGDVARMIMYMYVRYQTQCLPTVVGFGSTTFSNFGDMPDIFLLWNQQDTVSLYEKNRNTILENLQGNRNPFIDNPYIATLIWNGPAAVDTWNALATPELAVSNTVIYPTMTSDFIFIANSDNSIFGYDLYNTFGQLVSTGFTTSKIDLSGFSKGIYIVRLSSGNTALVSRVVLQ